MTSENIKAMLALCGKKQVELAEHFGMTKQSMNNKIAQDRWSVADLVKAADFCGCSVELVLPSGQRLTLEKEKAPDT